MHRHPDPKQAGLMLLALLAIALVAGLALQVLNSVEFWRFILTPFGPLLSPMMGHESEVLVTFLIGSMVICLVASQIIGLLARRRRTHAAAPPVGVSSAGKSDGGTA